jgi:CBS domain-containing protein
MSVGEICRREVDLVDPDETAWAAAERMWRREVGSLIVLDQERRPIGVVTARDLVVRVLAAERQPRATRVRDIMTTPVKTVTDTMSVSRAFALMRQQTIRRLPVVDTAGKLVGMLAQRDILNHLAGDVRHVDALDRHAAESSKADRASR